MRSKQGSIQSESAPLLAQPAKGGTDNGPLVWLLAVMAFLGSAGIAMTWGAQMVGARSRVAKRWCGCQRGWCLCLVVCSRRAESG